MAKVISTKNLTKSQKLFAKTGPCKKIYHYDRETDENKCKEGLIPFPNNIQQLMVSKFLTLIGSIENILGCGVGKRSRRRSATKSTNFIGPFR